ncbi:tellurite resistance TerB family protein [cf. Phormidesmis sp. LEGE 11477]|uniref:tellurite resistance TerB family protein n=1 Tax=cf. Phormidesmis sp. LEGE 11477 TaxID=1828680 RepID=UPI001880B992|nr:tellurite resistance TerB family protein [cf. Phormidesmis sp. LEGE 11477]MBE9061303.1 tellurite resistance TerB family protein [cf. Phormidesmis sp. LEGE 11477]
MGIFDAMFKTVGEARVAMNVVEAFTAICLVAIASDGYLSDAENEAMVLRLSRMQLFKDVTEGGFSRIRSYLLECLDKHGPMILIQSAKAALPPQLAPAAFTFAVDLAFADGTISKEEQAFIDDLRRILAIPDELALKIVEVMTIKNQA